MLQNFLTVALRNLWRNKLYALLNVLGLSVGIAALIWGWQTYRHCTSYDTFHPDRAHVFRAFTTKQDSEGLKGIFPLPMAQAAKADFASIAEVVRLDSRGLDVKADGSEPFTQQAHFTDPAFFEFFNFPLVAGNYDLSDKSAVLLTQEMATKFFGDENPLGKTLLFYAGEPHQMALTVKGVLRNPPMNSSVRFNFVTHFENMWSFEGKPVLADDWKWFLDAAFFKIPNPADAQRLAQDFKKYLPVQNSARQDWKASGFHLEPLANAANLKNVGANGLYERPDDSATFGPLVVAFLIFLCACLNFANTTVARSNRRLKEMGVRKVMGGTQGQLVRQLLLECGAVALLAILLSMQLNQWWLPTFNQMFEDIEVQANYLSDPPLLIFLACTLLGTTLLAGGYPAFYVSRFNPTSIFRGSVKFGGSNFFSRLLLGLQVAIALISVISSVGFSKNSAFQRTYDYGYDRENVMTISVYDENSFNAFRNEIRHLPGVEATAGTRHQLGFSYRTMTAEAQGEKLETAFFEVGEGYLDVMNLSIAAGRAFDPHLETDFENAMLVSEKFAGQMGWKAQETLGKQVRIDTVIYSVVGTLKDFQADDLFSPMEPVAMRLCRPARFQDLVIRAKPGELTSTFDQAKAAWVKLFPLKPFRGYYQNEVAAEAQQVTSSIATIFFWFALVSVLLTATGLFALVSLTVLKKMKEIAVRRVVGATPGHVMLLVNRGYFWIFLAGAALGCYGGWALTQLLLDMIFKINVGVGVDALAISASVVLGVAALTVAAKVWGAVRTNPAEVLKGD